MECGYDASTYAETVVKEHEELEELAKIIKAEKIKVKLPRMMMKKTA